MASKLPPSDSEGEPEAEGTSVQDADEPSPKHRSSFLRAMNNKPWVGAANMGPKRKELEAAGDGEPEQDEQPKAKKQKKTKTKKAVGKPEKPLKAAKTTKKGKQPEGRQPSRRLQLDDSDSESGEPLLPKPVVVPPKRQVNSTPGNKAKATASQAPRSITAEDSGEEASSSEDSDKDHSGQETSSTISADNNEDLERFENDNTALMAVLAAEAPRWARPSTKAKPEVATKDTQPTPPDLTTVISQVASTISGSNTSDMIGTYPAHVLIDAIQKALNADAISKATGLPVVAPAGTVGRSSQVAKSEMEPTKVKAKPKSHRELAIEKERPRFVSASSEATAVASSGAGTTSKPLKIEELRTLEETWPEQARLRYAGVRTINLKHQSSIMQKFIHAVIEDLAKHAAFITGIYPANERFRSHRRVVIETARRLKYADIKARLKDDEKFTKMIILQGEHRLALERGALKKQTQLRIAGAFSLDPRAPKETKLHVNKILGGLAFVYPLEQDGTPDTKSPFDLDIIAQVIAEHFFDGPASIAAANPAEFTSSSANKPNEKEIPEPMVALACAVIHLCLGDWSATGTVTKASNFSSSDAETPYNAAIGILDELRTKHPAQYHRVTHKVYANVRAIRDVDQATQEQQVAGAVAMLTFDEEPDL